MVNFRPFSGSGCGCSPSKWLKNLHGGSKWWLVTWLKHPLGKICAPSNWILSPLFGLKIRKNIGVATTQVVFTASGDDPPSDAHNQRHLDQFFQYFRLQRNGSIGFTSLRSRPWLVFVGWQTKPMVASSSYC